MEWQIRRRVAALPNVTLCDESPAEKLVTTPDRTRVTGVVIERRGAGKGMETLTADFVVDASGIGVPLRQDGWNPSVMPNWKRASLKSMYPIPRGSTAANPAIWGGHTW